MTNATAIGGKNAGSESDGRHILRRSGMRFKAVVFDMDGVIFDSEKVYRMMEHRAAAKYGLPDEKVEPFCNLIAG